MLSYVILRPISCTCLNVLACVPCARVCLCARMHGCMHGCKSADTLCLFPPLLCACVVPCMSACLMLHWLLCAYAHAFDARVLTHADTEVNPHKFTQARPRARAPAVEHAHTDAALMVRFIPTSRARAPVQSMHTCMPHELHRS
eukprot:1911616-Pleurochrysis_carterae.AAC.1